MHNNLNNSILKKIIKLIKKIQDKPENEKVRIMWILVIFCMLIMIGIWKINLDLNKSNRINSANNSDDLNIPPFPKLEGELREEVNNIEKLNEEESEEEVLKEDIEENKTEEELEDLKSKN